jgi:O-acetyl-ADP-ribose deacetylase (regulator of RNase III)
MGDLTQVEGRIEEQRVDVVVNSAHWSLLHGSGLSGAIHRAAGPELEAYCRTCGGCEVGSVVTTPAFNLRARWIIHAVSPKVLTGIEPTQEQVAALNKLYRSIFEEALRHGAWSIAVPPIGLGGHGFPADIAMPYLARACAAAARMFDFDVRFVSTDRSHHSLFRKEADW